MLLFYSNRLEPYLYVGYCFLLELFLLGFLDQPTLPFVGIGYILCLMKFIVPLDFHFFAFLLIVMASTVQGLGAIEQLVFWLIVAFTIMNFRLLLYTSRLVHILVVAVIMAIFSFWYGLDIWTVWNFFGILTLIPVMVNNFV